MQSSIKSVLRIAAAAAMVVLWSLSSLYAFDKLPESHPTYAAIKKVYLNVARAFGNRQKPPRLYVKSADSKKGPKIAVYFPGSVGILSHGAKVKESAIVVDERAFNVLQKEYGPERDSALAVLIGHELAHFYKAQGWVAEFGNAFADSDLGQQMTETARSEEVTLYELEADQFGGFYAYLAGYDALGMAPRVIDTIYAEFKLPAEMSGYPDKEARKKIALEAQKGLREMIPLFDTANRLLVIGRYEEAARLFDFIGGTFPSREILNNAGVCRALAALGLFRAGELKFAFPFEFDAETRLRTGIRTKGFGDDNEERRKELLEQAAHDFDSAINQDPGYAVAYLNRAAVLELADEHARALVDAEQGLKLAREQQEEATVANAHIIRGIIMARQNAKEKASDDFKAAQGRAESLAGLNMQALGEGAAKRIAPDARRKAAAPAELAEERIGGLVADDLVPRPREGSGGKSVTPLNPPSVERELSGAIDNENRLKIYIKEGATWTGSAVVAADSGFFLLATPPGYKEASGRGVRVGSTLEELAKRYGNAPRVVPSRQGSYHVYPAEEIVFAVGPDGKVTGWMTWSSVER